MKEIKVILFDIDGVLIRLPRFFAKELELNGYQNAEDCMNEYYAEHKHLPSNEGKEDCREKIVPYLRKFGWEHSVDEYLKQQFIFEHEYLDESMIHIVGRLKAQGVKCCLATDQEKHRAKYLLDEMGFRDIFDAHFVSCYIGARKCQELFWEYVINEFKNPPAGLEPDEIAFFDDVQKNLNTASRFGVRAFLFEAVSKFEKDMVSLGIWK